MNRKFTADVPCYTTVPNFTCLGEELLQLLLGLNVVALAQNPYHTCRAMRQSQGHTAAGEAAIYVIGDDAFEGRGVGAPAGGRWASGQRVPGGDLELQPMGPAWYAPPRAPLYGDRQSPVQARRPPIGRAELPMRPKSARGIRPASAIGRPPAQVLIQILTRLHKRYLI